jgi:putative membrane protein
MKPSRDLLLFFSGRNSILACLLTNPLAPTASKIQARRRKNMVSKATLRNFGLGLAIAGLCTLGAAAQAGSHGATNSTNAGMSTGKNVTVSDRTFMRKAAEGGKAEVELGKLAQEKAASPEVKQFGERMVNDHTKAGDELKQVAEKEGVTLPEKLDAKDAATKARLEKLSGDAFDRAYMRDMVKDHTEDVTEFRNEAKNGKDPEVKSFASQTVPTLEDHLKEAKNIAPKTTAQMAK